MKTNRRRYFVAAAITVVVGIGGITGLAASRPIATPLPPEQIDASEPIPPQTTISGDSAPEFLEAPRGEDFAREVAGTVFDWDASVVTREDVITAVVAIANEDEANGLLFDIDAYLPSPADWNTLRDLGTRQTIAIDAITVPGSWGRIVADNGEQVAPGTVAYTITGTRHREGQWHGEAQVFDEPVAFTAFIACTDGDSGGHCVLLRLSALNKPLD